MTDHATYLVLGATGGTGRHFVELSLDRGHQVRAFARDVTKLPTRDRLEPVSGSITEDLDLDALVSGVDFVVAMLGDVEAQKTRKINTDLVRRLVPAMRRHHVDHFLYQAGGLSTPPGQRLPAELWAIRNTIARGYNGQHQDNEAVMQYLVDEADDLAWVVHRAGIGSDGPSKGPLFRSKTAYSVATFHDVAAYNLQILDDVKAVHSCDLSTYREQ